MAFKATRTYIEAVATALSDNGKLKFKEGNEWQTNVKDKIIQYDPQSLLNLPPLVVKGLMLHETGHAKYTEPLADTEIVKNNPSMNDVYNALEDIRIEENLSRDYGAYADEGMKANASYSASGHLASLNSGEFKKHPKLHQFLLGILNKNYYYKYADNIYTSPSYCYYRMFDEDYANKNVVAKLNNISDTVIDKAKNAKSSQEIQDFADNWLYPRIKDLIDEANKNPKPLHANQSILQASIGLKGEYKPPAQFMSDNELDLILSPYINTLARRLSDILKERDSTRYTGSFKHGRLLSKNAYKVLTNENRIFSKRINPNKPHYTISLLLDGSGSMRGERHVNTYIAAYLIEKACKKLKFNIKLEMFETFPTMISNISSYRTNFHAGGNNEVLALQMIRKNTNPLDDNIIFMMTDGGAGKDPSQEIKELLKDNYTIIAVAIGLSDQNDKQFIDQLKKTYPYVVRAEDVEKLPIIMIETLKKLIHR